MKQKLNKRVKLKTKINRELGKIYYNIEKNEDKMNEINKIKTIERAIRKRKNYDRNYDDLSLRMSELKNSLIH